MGSAVSVTNLPGKHVKMPKREEKIQMETTKIFWRAVGPSDSVRTFTRDVFGTYKEREKKSVSRHVLSFPYVGHTFTAVLLELQAK